MYYVYLKTLPWDQLISAKIFVMLVRFREIHRLGSCLYGEYEDNVHALMQIV